VESVWLKHLILHLCPKLNFPSRRQISQEILLGQVITNSEDKSTICFSRISRFFSITTNFDLWMSKGAYDVFTLVINFLNIDYQLKHVTIGLFEVTKITGQTLARNLTKLLNKYGFRKKIIAYVKDEGSNSMQ
jgi:hypothetical protein